MVNGTILVLSFRGVSNDAPAGCEGASWNNSAPDRLRLIFTSAKRQAGKSGVGCLEGYPHSLGGQGHLAGLGGRQGRVVAQAPQVQQVPEGAQNGAAATASHQADDPVAVLLVLVDHLTVEGDDLIVTGAVTCSANDAHPDAGTSGQPHEGPDRPARGRPLLVPHEGGGEGDDGLGGGGEVGVADLGGKGGGTGGEAEGPPDPAVADRGKPPLVAKLKKLFAPPRLDLAVLADGLIPVPLDDADAVGGVQRRLDVGGVDIDGQPVGLATVQGLDSLGLAVVERADRSHPG
ncbi:MAG: hypothetical protein COU31_01090 [Candidatus Magasanikbacteria bacterium CG10_big_fil_rev_8_21_14_0_10_40_10]|uniref:Uncharacterized protein n=1 Tax=Candidatus Magasanikbacteria bacterium CG10_big_fil_rev_8_21_14_0_10_40_10 TaxID=1974648 RepID=A0A2M6W502_9BACT|nr:MAG: hypothetical protein COU31_01090 [Candidatus Magasanikbacteria bacterium CG10_big_fil_rev_8_21_14_0_10_40_10]